MGIRIDYMNIMGNKELYENNLPKYRAKIQNPILEGDGLLEEEKKGYGYQTGDRYLPYKWQDKYMRNKSNISIKTIVMENDYQKAVFLPEYGMRLYSLYDKILEKDLLYVNPVFQLANLAIRKAWFSGGIEWNFGQLGHSFTTCENVHVGICTDENGEEFIRCYEYERCKGLYWNLDFYLRKEDRELSVYGNFKNKLQTPESFYWWTNIAAKQEKKVRVLSGTKEVIYIQPETNEAEGAVKGMAHGQLPYISAVPGEDVTYPENIDFASEYFFQGEKSLDQTWEAAVYDDGFMFFERSTEVLRYRKMFCWGSHQGGKKWQEFLTEKGTGDYFEMQAGFAPTQVHGILIPENTEWDFVQVFGGKQVEIEPVQVEEYEQAISYVYEQINECYSESQLKALEQEMRNNKNNPIEKVIHLGLGYGYLEELKTPGITPKGYDFNELALTEETLFWKHLLEFGEVLEVDTLKVPLSYMVDVRWEQILLRSAQKESYTAYNLLGVMYYENGFVEKAKDAFVNANKICENTFSYRNLAIIASETSEKEAVILYEKGIELLGVSITREYAEEFIESLIHADEIEKAWDFYCTLPESLKEEERVRLIVLQAAAKLGNIEFLEQQYEYEFSSIREGERGYTDTYFTYQAIMEAQKENIEVTDELIEQYRSQNLVPQEIDFRLSKR